MSNNINPDEFVLALMEATRTMTEEVVEEIENGLEQIGRDTVKELRRTAPVFKGNDKNRRYKKGTYRRSWYMDIKKANGVKRVIVYCRYPHSNLTHLLEHGHLVKNGTGRVLGNAPPIPHIAEAEKHAEEKLDKLLEGL